MAVTDGLRAVSSGGGQQTIALLVLSAQGVVDFPLHLFSNVGDGAEKPETLAYVRDVAMPYAAEHGIEFVELTKRNRHGEPIDLYERVTRPESRSLPIPVRMANGAPGNRSCTFDHKIEVVSRELRRRGATEDAPATLAVGISVEEVRRAGTRRPVVGERVVYPLLDLRLRRTDCQRIIRDAGLPVPPPSSCWFCPFRRPTTWAAMRAEEPEQFERAAELEDQLNERRHLLGKDSVWLTRFARPLRDVIPEGVQMLPFLAEDPHDDGCDGEVCWT